MSWQYPAWYFFFLRHQCDNVPGIIISLVYDYTFTCIPLSPPCRCDPSHPQVSDWKEGPAENGLKEVTLTIRKEWAAMFLFAVSVFG